jgi:hypothetical protein
VVGFTGQERFGFQFGDVGVGGGELFVEFFEQIVFLLDVGFLPGEIDVGLDIAGDGGELFVGGNLFFGALAIAKNALRGFLIAPKIGVGSAGLEGFQALAELRCVKDSSARAKCAA